MIEEYVGKPLPASLIDTIAVATSDLGDVSAKILQQARVAQIRTYTPTNIDVIVPADAPSIASPNGPAPGRAMAFRDGNLMPKGYFAQ